MIVSQVNPGAGRFFESAPHRNRIPLMNNLLLCLLIWRSPAVVLSAPPGGAKDQKTISVGQ